MGRSDDADFLRIREILKERIRKEKRMSSNSADECSVDRKKVPKHRSFFGPSQHCIAQRLIDGRDALMQELKISAEDLRKVEIPDTVTDSESSESESEFVLANVAKLKESRDYSFLSTDVEEVPKEDDGVDKDISVSKSSNNKQTPGSIQPVKTVSGTQSPSSAKKGQSETKRRMKNVAKKVDDEDSDEDEDEDEDDGNVNVSSIIQGLFRGNRKRPPTLDYYDRDDRAMVSSFADIEREEKRSAKLARQEDEIEALRIEQEEKMERLRRAKKQKQLLK